jgi:glycosyltransferase involved in cell wall biosynthesis
VQPENPMLMEKIAILSPTTIQFVEKMACLNPATGIDVVGPPPSDQFGWNSYQRRMKEWRELGLNVRLDLRPYDEINFAHYDVLVETYETLSMEPSWLQNCERYECPVAVKACWTRHPMEAPPGYFDKIRTTPIMLEMPAHLANWETCGCADVNLVFNPVGSWWFDEDWTGADDRAVMVLSGRKQWRQERHHGIVLFERLVADFPGQVYLHDGTETYRTSRQMADLLRRARIFLALDEPYGNGERPLSLVFTEALSAGCPVAARDLPGLNYKDYIQGNGICTNDYGELKEFVGRCLSDYDFAYERSSISRTIARSLFSVEALVSTYSSVFKKAREVWRHRQAHRTFYLFRPAVMSSFGTQSFG